MDPRTLPAVVKRSLFSLLFIPVLAATFLLVWKVSVSFIPDPICFVFPVKDETLLADFLSVFTVQLKSRRNAPSAPSSTEDPPLFIGAEPSAPPLEDEISEKYVSVNWLYTRRGHSLLGTTCVQGTLSRRGHSQEQLLTGAPTRMDLLAGDADSQRKKSSKDTCSQGTLACRRHLSSGENS